MSYPAAAQGLIGKYGRRRGRGSLWWKVSEPRRALGPFCGGDRYGAGGNLKLRASSGHPRCSGDVCAAGAAEPLDGRDRHGPGVRRRRTEKDARGKGSSGKILLLDSLDGAGFFPRSRIPRRGAREHGHRRDPKILYGGTASGGDAGRGEDSDRHHVAAERVYLSDLREAGTLG